MPQTMPFRFGMFSLSATGLGEKSVDNAEIAVHTCVSGYETFG